MNDKTEPTIDEKLDKALETVRNRLLALNDQSDMQKAGQAVLNLTITKSVYAGLVEPSDELDEEISFVLGKVRSNSAATDMQHATQAALNLMQAKGYMAGVKSHKDNVSSQQGKVAPKKQVAGA